jgi:hypothetical protein
MLTEIPQTSHIASMPRAVRLSLPNPRRLIAPKGSPNGPYHPVAVWTPSARAVRPTCENIEGVIEYLADATQFGG